MERDRRKNDGGRLERERETDRETKEVQQHVRQIKYLRYSGAAEHP